METDKFVVPINGVIVPTNIGFITSISISNPSNIYIVISAFFFSLTWAFTSDDTKYIEKNQMAREIKKQGFKNS